MENTLLKSYQIEYETTPITIDELAHKYDISKDQLKGHEAWTKLQPTTTEATTNEHLATTPLVTTTTPLVTTTTSLATSTSNQEEDQTIMEDINTFKQAAIKKAILFMSNKADYASVREIKDMTSLVMEIEKSYKGTETGPTVNVLVQNITERFKDDV